MIFKIKIYEFFDGIYQTEHFLAGFMLDPTGQFQSWANSLEFLQDPLTRNLPGEWGSVNTRFLRVAGRMALHQMLAPDNQNSWRLVQGRPGRRGSSPYSLTKRLYALNKNNYELKFKNCVFFNYNYMYNTYLYKSNRISFYL